MDIKMNFNKILIQDLVNKRDYNQDTYRTTNEVSDDDETSCSDDFNHTTGKCFNERSVQANANIDSSNCSNLFKDYQAYGDNNNFIYADSQIFDRVDQNYGSEIGRDSVDKLISALELLKINIEQNTMMYDQRGNQSRPNRFQRLHHHHHHHHHLNRRNTVAYSDDSEGRKNLDILNDERMLKRKEKVVVEVRVVFLKIGEIDTLKEIYHADAFIQSKWRESKFDNKTDEELKTVDLDRCWNPLLFIDNILNETKDQYWLSAEKNEKGEVYVIERRKMKGVFLETLELNDFPLDVQDLTITISSERPDSEIDLVPDTVDLSGINVQTFIDQQEWKLHEHVEVTKRAVTQEYTSSSRCHPCLSVTCRASRRPGYFYWNVFLVMFFITGLSFATFAVPTGRAENRLQLSFTLFLTSVAFKFVINQSLPRISYLTYMDKYVLMSLAILCIISIWHSVVTLIKPSNMDARIVKFNTSATDQKNLSSETQSSYSFESKKNTLLKSILLKSNLTLPLLKYSTKKSDKLLLKLSEASNIPKLKDDTVTMMPISDENKKLLSLRLRQTANFQKKIERDILISFALVYFFAHFMFIFWLYFDASKRRREMIEKDRQYKEWVKRNKEWVDNHNQQHSYGHRHSNLLMNRV